MMRPLRFTVSAADLERAISRTQRKDHDTCADCLLAVALTRRLGRVVKVGHERWGSSDGEYGGRLSGRAMDLVSMFDSKRYDDLRAQLPARLRIELEA